MNRKWVYVVTEISIGFYIVTLDMKAFMESSIKAMFPKLFNISMCSIST